MIKLTSEMHLLINLLTAAIEEKSYFIGNDPIDWDKITKYLTIQNLMGMAYIGYQQAEDKEKVPPELVQKMIQGYKRCIIIEAHQHIALEELKTSFQNAKICFLPLKGSILKYEYKLPQIRYMCDLDILFKLPDWDKMNRTMKNLGYQIGIKEQKDISYTKKPFVNVEMHFNLMEEDITDAEYFNTIWDRSTPVESESFEYKMTWEDYYLYMLKHLSKHLTISGSGFRSLTDFHVFYKNKYHLLNHSELNKKLEQLHLKKLENVLIELDKCLFYEHPWNDETLYDIFQYIIDSGIYGNEKNLWKNRLLKSEHSLDKSCKLKWFLKKVFPKMTDVKKYYPWMQKHHYPYPIAWLRLSFERIFFRKKHLLSTAKTVSDIDTADLKKAKKMFEKLGLNHMTNSL